MKEKYILRYIMVFWLAIVSISTEAADYSIELISTGVTSLPTRPLNENGEVIGALINGKGFHWSNGIKTELQPLSFNTSGYGWSYPYSINNNISGQIVGGSEKYGDLLSKVFVQYHGRMESRRIWEF